jgi:hypothetical protein
MGNQGLTSEIARDLREITNVPGHKMKGTAEQLLAFWNEGIYEELLELPLNGRSKAMRIPKLEDIEIENLTVNPNPTNGAFYVNYLLPEGWEEATLIVYDNTGKVVSRYDASQFNGIIEMDGKELPSGFYTVVLNVDAVKLATTKLTILH